MREQVISFLRKNWVMPTGIGVASFGGGLAAGYFLARHRLKKTETNEPIQLQFNFDSSKFGETYSNTPVHSNTGVYTDVREKMLRLEELDRNEFPYASKVYVTEETEIEVEIEDPPAEDEGGEATVVNIFARSADPEWDYEEELSTRTPDHPYIIHKDEFFSDEMGWDSQSTLTWYEGDQILCDEQDVPIYNPDAIVGHLRFGHGSGDPNVVYVRNEKLEAEYEILRDPGSYEIDVLGGQVERTMQETDLKHSHRPGKFREA